LGIKRSFSAEHFLVGGDWGDENQPHSHSYTLQVQLRGDRLNEHGYLVDIIEFEGELDKLTEQYEGSQLNALPEFNSLNPSIEHFSRILCGRLDRQLAWEHIHTIIITLWEDDIAWASFRLQR
jgi:6-pyruvoyltetrahydropterin/6-carboxytetrahydropterin synthase